MNAQSTSQRNYVPIGLLAIAAAFWGVGCSTTNSTKARPLESTLGVNVNLSKYQVASVISFVDAAGAWTDAGVGERFAQQLAARLERDFPSLFSEVRRGPGSGRDDELIVTGKIRVYDPGSRFARFLLAGAGTATLKGDLILEDAADHRVLYYAPFDKVWEWGGVLGASKGIEDMEAEVAAAMASTIARAKGWSRSSARVNAN